MSQQLGDAWKIGPVRQLARLRGSTSLLCWGNWLAMFVVLLSASVGEAQLNPFPSSVDRAALEFQVMLASPIAEDVEQQRATLNKLHEEFNRVARERLEYVNVFAAPPDKDFTTLTVPEADALTDQLWAIRQLFARSLGAQGAGQPEWMRRQMAAARQHSSVVAKLFAAQAAEDEVQAERLGQLPFAVRRSAEPTQSYFEKLRREGLTPRQHTLLKESGYTDAQTREYLTELLAMPPEEIGMSLEEGYLWIAITRRELARRLEEFSQGDVRTYFDDMNNSFLVGNPSDREATIDLYIRPVSISPLWKLSVVDAAEAVPDGEGTRPMVQEVKAGEHYRVRLPAGGETLVASLLMPVGPVGPNTTARWAVEGKIGDKLIGGMMHEMHVPAVAADPELPPVATAPVAVDTTAPSGRLAMLLIVGALVVSVLLAVILVLRIRKTKDGAS